MPTASMSVRSMSSRASVWTSAMPAASAALRALSAWRLHSATTSHPSDANAGTYTCEPKPTPMMPTLRLDAPIVFISSVWSVAHEVRQPQCELREEEHQQQPDDLQHHELHHAGIDVLQRPVGHDTLEKIRRQRDGRRQ